MRLVLAMVLAVLVGLPLSVSAQPAEEDSLSSWQVDEGASLEQAAPEEPALELKLDDAGVEVAPIPQTVAQRKQEIERMGRRMKPAWIGFGVSAGVLAVGVGTILAASVQCVIGEWTERCNRIENAGIIVTSAGGAGMIASGIVLGVRKRKLRRLIYAHYETPRRVQWDLARSRLVF